VLYWCWMQKVIKRLHSDALQLSRELRVALEIHSRLKAECAALRDDLAAVRVKHVNARARFRTRRNPDAAEATPGIPLAGMGRSTDGAAGSGLGDAGT
jgi:hypothetical protein